MGKIHQREREKNEIGLNFFALQLWRSRLCVLEMIKWCKKIDNFRVGVGAFFTLPCKRHGVLLCRQTLCRGH